MSKFNARSQIILGIFVYIFILYFPLNPVHVRAELNIGSDILESIAGILEKPLQVYDLDLKTNEKVLNRIDTVFSKYLDFDKAQKRQKKNSNRVNYLMKSRKNIAVIARPEGLEGIKIEKPINIWYVKEPRKRSFMKELRVPSKKSLPREEIIHLGESFITMNNFCEITDRDRLVATQVVSRNRRTLGTENEEQENVILQRVIFKREFDGVQVINSRQIVDIQPTSREIISYKNIMWTPVNENSGKMMPYVSREEIVGKIKQAVRKGKTRFDVAKIKVGRYLTNNVLLPVLLVYMKQTEPKRDPLSPVVVLIIDLVKDAPVSDKGRESLRPATAE